MPENVFAQPNLNVHYASRINTYKYTRTLKVDDVLNYFDNVHLANNNYEVVSKKLNDEFTNPL